MKGPDGLDGVRISSLLVGSIALDPGESEGYPTRIPGARLDSIEGDFHDLLRMHMNDMPLPPALQLEEAFRLPLQRLVRESFEGLAQHDETAVLGVPGSQVEIAEPALSPA